ncbi:MAG: hypothetical protein KGL39_49790 [Patescibacteria group bacterium]|nr:hypothetical protein [Patescibacteria group bacterium]
MKRPPDMSRKQFLSALRARGWKQVMWWVDIGGGRSIGLVLIGGKINRRASLAHAIRESERPSRAPHLAQKKEEIVP